TNHTRSTQRSGSTQAPLPRRPQIYPNDSMSTLVGSALERKLNEVDSIRGGDTTDKLEDLRRHMATHDLDYYIVPSEDAHGSEYVSESDKRREYISGFTGTAGQAVITVSSAYLFTDSRYWIQAREQLDVNWTLIKAGAVGQPRDWIEWLVERTKGDKIGIDARMISHEKATLINSKIQSLDSKLIYPPQNLVDLVWKDKPAKSKAPIYIQPYEFTGMEATEKMRKLREWIHQQPASIPTYSKAPAKLSDMQVGTLITALPSIAYLLNLRGSDIPHNPLFHAYLFIGLESAIIFIDASKVTDETLDYIKSIGVERQDYLDFWTFLRRRSWGEGKLLITPQTSYAISLMLTHYRYTVAPAFVETMLSVKNKREIDGLRRAYLRDGASFVRFLAWLETKLSEGYDITEYEAASRLTEFRRHNKHFMGLAYKSISATGPNAALPHYTPKKSTA
ncbi:Creatinase/Prolidase N-terminal domain-containing protein, partial [Collybia nuda]